MEAVNLVKGYGKVNNISADDPTSYHHPDKLAATNRRKTAVISLLILFSLLSVTTLAVFIYKSTTNHNSPGSKSTATPSQSLSANRVESTRTVCAVTQYPDSCISALSELPNLPPELGPELIFILYVQISVSQLKNVSSLPKTLISKSNEPRTLSALRDCASLFDDAASQLNNSVKLMTESPEKKVLTEAKIADVNSWISAAMTDQDTCLDGLEEMESTVLDEMDVSFENCSSCMVLIVAVFTMWCSYMLELDCGSNAANAFSFQERPLSSSLEVEGKCLLLKKARCGWVEMLGTLVREEVKRS